MRQIGLVLSIIILAVLLAPQASAGTGATNVDTVRRMCTAPDNQDFSVFDQETLPGILIEIIRDDHPEAEYHKRVVSSALKALGALHVPEAVGVLASEAPEYPTICLHWLGTFASSEAVSTIVAYLGDEDPSVRCEAADALARLPAQEEETEGYMEDLAVALEQVAERLSEEEDGSVREALQAASEHIAGLLAQPGGESSS